MKLTGIIENVFRGITIFRGYATLRTLAKLSASTSYQRDKDIDRIESIKEYIETSSYVFFPELILGWQLDNLEAIRKIKEEEDTSSITLSNGIKIKKAKFRFKALAAGEEPKTKVVTIEIPDTFADIIFNRIDGNHRLSVIDMIKEETGTYDDQICNQIVPFCLIIQNKSDDATKYESAYFFLINSKAKALTYNENLKSILQGNRFTEAEKKDLLSLEEYQIRYIQEVANSINETRIDFIKETFNDESYTFCYRFIIEGLRGVSVFEAEEVQKICKAIEWVNISYKKGEIENVQVEVLLALVVLCYLQKDKYDYFLDWINKNELGYIENLSCGEILHLFENLHKQRSYKVFVAMPYISFKRVNEYNRLFKEALEEISRKVGFGLELIPIMRFRGESQRIDRRLIEKIKECDIFIGDLTTVNDNVIFEVGLAEGFDKKLLLIRAEEDTERLPFDKASQLDKGKIIPFDMDKLQYIPYSNSGYYNDIKSILRNNIPVIVEQLRSRQNV